MKIGLIGSGNVAFHLATYFQKKNICIKWIYGRNSTTVNELCNLLATEPQYQLTKLPIVDVIIVCVSDNAIQSVVEQLPSSACILITSGTFDITNISLQKPNVGVLYPLQTFTKNAPLAVNEIPFIIEIKTQIVHSMMNQLINSSELQTFPMNYVERKKIHLSAVFLNNFINHLVCLIQEKSNKENIDFKIFNPLITETIRKIINQPAKEIQTGPAKRKDTQTITAHEQMLEGNLLQLYQLFTKSILETYK